MKMIVFILILILSPTAVFADLNPLTPLIEPLPDTQVDILFKKIRQKEKIPVLILHQALKASQTTLRADAARELGIQGDSTSIPYLIEALADDSFHVGAMYPEAGMSTTRYWANESLKKLTGKDFGFIWNDPHRKQAILKWHEWYKKSSKSERDIK